MFYTILFLNNKFFLKNILVVIVEKQVKNDKSLSIYEKKSENYSFYYCLKVI